MKFLEKQFSTIASDKYEPQSLKDLRSSAFNQFKEIGFPKKSWEAWRFTAVENVEKNSFRLSNEADLPEETLEDPVMETDPVQQQINQEGSQEGADVDLRQKASEVLRVRSSDDRLWRKAQPEVFELEPAEIMELMLAGRLEIWVDSVYKAMEAENALTDWTRTDSEGRRWGVSPGRLHMGDISIPLPIYFGQNSWQRERSTRRAWEDRDIMNASSGAAVRQSWRERAEAIRRRRDRERSETVMPPDTIRK